MHSFSLLTNRRIYLIQILLFFQEWPHLPFKSKGFSFYITMYAIMHRRLNLWFQNLKPTFQGMHF